MSVDLAQLYGSSDSSEMEYGYGEANLYPQFYWRGGDRASSIKSAGKTSLDNGGLFLPLDKIPTRSDFDREGFEAALVKMGFIKDSFVPQGSGDDSASDGEVTLVEGYYKEFVVWNQINHRKAYFGIVKGKGQKPKGRNLGSFEQIKAQFGVDCVRSTYQAMVSIPGLEKFAPFIFSTKVSSAMAYEGTRTDPGVIRTFMNSVVKPIDDDICKRFKLPLARKVPLYEFNIPVGVLRDAKGNVQFTKIGEGTESRWLALPALIDVRPNMKAEEIRKTMMISDDQRAALTELWELSKEWAAEWKFEDKPADATTQAQTAKQAQVFAPVEGM